MDTTLEFCDATADDLEALATLYTHHWCNLVPDADDKILAARYCVLVPLKRSTSTILAKQDGKLLGCVMGSVFKQGRVSEIAPWDELYAQTRILALERAKTADAALEGQLFGDEREFIKADEFIATGNPYAEAQLNLFMVEPELIGTGLGGELFSRMKQHFIDAGARRFFLMTDTASNFAYYEHRGMKRIWERYDDPTDPNSWGALMYGGELTEALS